MPADSESTCGLVLCRATPGKSQQERPSRLQKPERFQLHSSREETLLVGNSKRDSCPYYKLDFLAVHRRLFALFGILPSTSTFPNWTCPKKDASITPAGLQ